MPELTELFLPRGHWRNLRFLIRGGWKLKLYPAIDIRNGQAVRLKQGDYAQETVYYTEPYKAAMEFEVEGSKYIHVVDLDGAKAGTPQNIEVIDKIIKNVHIPIEVGGGIRTMADIETRLSRGVDRVILGTAAVKNPDFLAAAVEKYGPDHVVAGIDAKDGIVMISGWEQSGNVTAAELSLKMKKIGVTTIIYTDISRDGMMVGPNIAKTKELADASGMKIIASGGISSMDDLAELNAASIYGAVFGKAIYERKINLREAVKLFE